MECMKCSALAGDLAGGVNGFNVRIHDAENNNPAVATDKPVLSSGRWMIGKRIAGKSATQRATKVIAGGFPVAVGCHRAIELTRAALGNGGRFFVSANPVARICKGRRTILVLLGENAGWMESIRSRQNIYVHGLRCDGLKIKRLGVAEIAVVGDVQVRWIIDGAVNHECREVGTVEGGCELSLTWRRMAFGSL